MKSLLLLLLFVAPAACTTAPQTPAQSVYAVQSNYAAALTVAVKYKSLPPCAPDWPARCCVQNRILSPSCKRPMTPPIPRCRRRRTSRARSRLRRQRADRHLRRGTGRFRIDRHHANSRGAIMIPTAIAYALQVLTAIPQLLAAGQSVIGLVEHSQTALKSMQDENRDPTPAEWDALNSLIDGLRKQLHDD